MHFYFRAVALLLMTMLSTTAVAVVSEASVDRLLKVSGLEVQVGFYPAMVVSGLNQAAEQGGNISAKDLDLIVANVHRTILPNDILASVTFALRSSMTQQEVDYLLDWYQTKIGQRVTRAEELASTPEAYAAAVAMGDSLLRQTVRVEHARRLDQLMGLTDFNLSLQESSSVAVYGAMLAALQPDQPINLNAIKAEIQRVLEQSKPAIRQSVVISSVYTYRDMSFDELLAYETFLRDPRTQKFSQRAMNGLAAGFEEAVSNMGRAMADNFSRH